MRAGYCGVGDRARILSGGDEEEMGRVRHLSDTATGRKDGQTYAVGRLAHSAQTTTLFRSPSPSLFHPSAVPPHAQTTVSV